MYGDLGKVDLGGDDKADNFEADDDSNACSADDGGSAKGKDLDNGTLCDAKGVEIATSVSYPLGLGYGCDAGEGGITPSPATGVPVATATMLSMASTWAASPTNGSGHQHELREVARSE